MITAQRRNTAIAVAIAVAVVIAALAISVSLWTSLGNTEIGLSGWIAMILGVLATLALGIGLMSLVFISARRGYDDQGDGR